MDLLAVDVDDDTVITDAFGEMLVKSGRWDVKFAAEIMSW
jgi:hypothetical protein